MRDCVSRFFGKTSGAKQYRNNNSHNTNKDLDKSDNGRKWKLFIQIIFYVCL